MHYVKAFLTYALAALFLFASVMKFAGTEMEVMGFQAIGLGLWFMYFTAAWELLTALFLVLKKYRLIGLIMAVLLFIGAFIAQVFFIKADWIHTVVLAAIAGWLAYSQYIARRTV